MRRASSGKSQEKISRLISVAELEFARVGLGAASLETIAVKAGVSRQLIYNKYGGKQGLYTAVQTVARSTLFESLLQHAWLQASPAGTISNILKVLFDRYAASPLLGRSVADEGFLPGPGNDHEGRLHRIYGVIEGYLAQGRLLGEVKREWSGQAFFDCAVSLIAGVTAMGGGAAYARDITVDFIIRALTAIGDGIEESELPHSRWTREADVTSIERIISAAEAEFACSGVESSSFSAIARRGGVSKQLIYYHFKNKATLYKAVQDRLLHRVLPHFEALSLKSLTPMAAVQAYVGTYEQVQAAYPNSMKLDLDNRLQRGGMEVGDASGRNRIAHFLRRFDEVIMRGKADGSIHDSMNATLLFNFSAIIFSSGKGVMHDAQIPSGAASTEPRHAHSIAREFIVFGSTA
jgi:Transcriptional regulator